MRFALRLALVLLSFSMVFAQTPARERLLSIEKNALLHQNSIFKNLSWQERGPYFCSGRIVDVEVYQNDPYTYWVATASGGLFKTVNNATTWKSLFDRQESITIGDIAISQTNSQLIWVGTGEANSSRSSYAGTGIYKSEDGGETWKRMGLEESHHISRVLIDPLDNDTVYVAVLGHLYTENGERGLYKTSDGGKNWEKVLNISAKTGIVDLVMDPRDSQVLYAAAWQKDRKAWNLVEGGPESGIYKSVDGGANWEKIGKGFPQNEHVGRIGLAIAASRPDTVYAFLDNQAPRPEERKVKVGGSGIAPESLLKMDKETFLKIPLKNLELFLRENKLPERITAEMIHNYVGSDQITPATLAQQVMDASTRLFQTNIIGAEVYRSDDGGMTWNKANAKYIDGLIYTYGYYFGQIRVSPDNENLIYLLGVPLLKSEDGGNTFCDISLQGGIYGVEGVHADMHALWINPQNHKHLLLGNDGGLNISYDQGKSWQKAPNLPLAQCYTVSYDLQEPYNIYTGLQDNGVNMGPSDFVFRGRDTSWKMILGGDGAFVEPDPHHPDTVYAAFQFGSIYRISLKNDEATRNIQPRSPDRSKPYRFNWLSPFRLSAFNSGIIYMGANKVLRSVDRGDNWVEISPDLTAQKNTDGDVPYATITALDESPLSGQVLYAGTDDGKLWLTRDGGCKWDNIGEGLPGKWVSRVVASRYEKGRVYVSMIGYREDDFKTYLYVSEDFGTSWNSIQGNLADEPVNVIREDPVNDRILYLGTDISVYVSLDRGQSWQSLRANLPTNAVYDIKVQPMKNDLIIGTHGRGVFTLSLAEIQKLNAELMARDFHSFGLKFATRYRDDAPQKEFTLTFFNKAAADLTCTLLQGKKTINSWNKAFDAGLNSWTIEAKKEGKILPKGEYLLKIGIGKKSWQEKLKID